MLAAACSGGDDDAADEEPVEEVAEEGEEGGTWTVLQYHMADTDLEPFMMEDLEEMGYVGSVDDLTYLALVDRSADFEEMPVLDQGDWVGTRLLHLGPDGSTELSADLGQANLGDPATLAGFLGEQLAANPADHYALIVSDHGGAWEGFGPDDSGGFDTLTIPELEQGLAAGLAQAGVEQLDLIGFDACLMASYEVASLLAPHARRMLASAELVPGHGFDYTAFGLAAEGAPLDELGVGIIDAFLAQAEEAGQVANLTMALLDLERMPALDAALAELTGTLAADPGTFAPVVGRSRAVAPGYGRSPDPDQDTHMADLGALVAPLAERDDEVAELAEAVDEALDDVVVYSVEGPRALDHSGLAIYFPEDPAQLSETYPELGDRGGWLSSLRAYYAAGAALDPGTHPQLSPELDVTFDEDGLFAEATLAAPELSDQLVRATISYAVVHEDGSLTPLGEEPGEVADDGSGTVTGFRTAVTSAIVTVP